MSDEGMNIDGLSLEEVVRLFRLGEKNISRLSRELRQSEIYASRLESELEEFSPECRSCIQFRRDSGGLPRAPKGQHQGGCPQKNEARGPSPWCCHVDKDGLECKPRPADFEIRYGRAPDEYTHACAEHVGTMFADFGPYVAVYPIKEIQ